MEKFFQSNTIPPGLADDRIEFFTLRGEMMFLQSGKLHSFDELTIDDLTLLANELHNDHKAEAGLDILGITDPIERLKQFAFCRFGGLDSTADIDFEDMVMEYWDCGHRPCPVDGMICRLPHVSKGKLTRHDVQIMRGIGNDRLNKEIASDLGITVDTVNKECHRIAEKIGVYSKAGIAAFAGKTHIV